MPVRPTYPGVYVEELPSGVRTITGVSTAVTAFVGRAVMGPVDTPVTINNFGDFQRHFGGLWNASSMSFAVQDYFLNGGSQALVVRVLDPAQPATASLAGFTFATRRVGSSGNRLRVKLTASSQQRVSVVIEEKEGERWQVVETHPDLALETFAETIEQNSRLVVVTEAPEQLSGTLDEERAFGGGGGEDADVTPATLLGSAPRKSGLYALEKADLFTMLCIPDADADTLGKAAAYCEQRRAMLIIDPPGSWATTELDQLNVDDLGARSKNAAVFFPRIRKRNPLRGNALESFPPCGAVAGVFARTDAERGIWKAPAGTEAGLVGVVEPEVPLTDAENGQLNPRAINCIRSLPPFGTVVWGSRTLLGNDAAPSDWKYIPVRRTALYIEESLFRGTQWAVFEPNDEPLWAQLRLNIGVFLHDLFRQGAFQGGSPREAYFVKCDHETNPQSEIDKGIVNIVVGFAPLKPAEFVILQFQQIAGQT